MSLVLGSLPVYAGYAAGPAGGKFPGKLRLQDGKLTARIAAVPLPQVMEEVGRLSGAQVRWLGQGGEEPVSVEFTDCPFSEALRRILGEKNFLLFYASRGGEERLVRIWISSKGTGGKQPALISQPVPAVRSTPMPVSNPALQAEEDLDTLMQTAMYDENPFLRVDAIVQLGGRAQEDPRIKAILSQVAHDGSPQVQEAVAAMLKDME